MQWSEMKEEILRTLKEPTSDGTWTDAELLKRANIIQRRVCRESECIITTDTSTTSVADTAEYAKISTCLRIIKIKYGDTKLYGLDANTLDVEETLDNIGSPWQDQTGTPTHYYETAINIGLYPKPDSTGDTITQKFVALASDMVGDTSIPFNDLSYLVDYHDLIIQGVLWKCMFEDSDDRWTEAKNEFIQGIAKLRADMKNKQQILQTFSLARRKNVENTEPLPFTVD